MQHHRQSFAKCVHKSYLLQNIASDTFKGPMDLAAYKGISKKVFKQMDDLKGCRGTKDCCQRLRFSDADGNPE